jgi:hypothetical protein
LISVLEKLALVLIVAITSRCYQPVKTMLSNLDSIDSMLLPSSSAVEIAAGALLFATGSQQALAFGWHGG